MPDPDFAPFRILLNITNNRPAPTVKPIIDAFNKSILLIESITNEMNCPILYFKYSNAFIARSIGFGSSFICLIIKIIPSATVLKATSMISVSLINSLKLFIASPTLAPISKKSKPVAFNILCKDLKAATTIFLTNVPPISNIENTPLNIRANLVICSSVSRIDFKKSLKPCTNSANRSAVIGGNTARNPDWIGFKI